MKKMFNSFHWFGQRYSHCRIGLEISDEQLRFAVAARSKQKWRLIQTGMIESPLENPDRSLQCVRREIPAPAKEITLGIPYHQAIIKEIRVDSALTGDEMYSYLQHHSARCLGAPFDHWFLDFEPLTPLCWRVAATKRAFLSPWIKRCREAGFKIRAIDVDVFALARLLPFLSDYHPQKPQALVWKKRTELLFIVAQNGRLLYVKSSAIFPEQSLTSTLKSLVQFFYGLYPKLTLANALILNEYAELNIDSIPFHKSHLPLKPAILNNFINKTPPRLESSVIGLCTHGY